MDLTPQLLQRFKCIELLSFWEGGVNATRLSRIFSIGSNVINAALVRYRKLHPFNLAYNGKDPEKLFVITSEFVPQYISGSWEEYVKEILLVSTEHTSQTYSSNAFFVAPPAVTQVSHETTSILLKAIRTHRDVKIFYRSRSEPKGQTRRITPHAIASDGIRWHCRAYCHLRYRFSDFNLSRIESITLGERAEIDTTDDSAWHTEVEVTVEAHPKLDPAVRELVLSDYGQSGTFTFKVRGAMLDYTLQYYRIGKDQAKTSPLENPLVVQNYHEIEPYLFKDE
ncbi:WYL domain-containing protein [Shewanella xiamenensis]|nr:WYL domain-containing protein [Shewanella xiamenensis]MCT8872130.1 WYL domain-containing protein [Shewanella xiamenensis]MCT8877950.1 WYL domain-containing protein [Shewanella xiamenensis]UWH40038.1 WYL domain-containing protein [Shewanella xiamenensis]